MQKAQPYHMGNRKNYCLSRALFDGVQLFCSGYFCEAEQIFFNRRWLVFGCKSQFVKHSVKKSGQGEAGAIAAYINTWQSRVKASRLGSQ